MTRTFATLYSLSRPSQARLSLLIPDRRCRRQVGCSLRQAFEYHQEQCGSGGQQPPERDTSHFATFATATNLQPVAK